MREIAHKSRGNLGQQSQRVPAGGRHRAGRTLERSEFLASAAKPLLLARAAASRSTCAMAWVRGAACGVGGGPQGGGGEAGARGGGGGGRGRGGGRRGARTLKLTLVRLGALRGAIATPRMAWHDPRPASQRGFKVRWACVRQLWGRCHPNGGGRTKFAPDRNVADRSPAGSAEACLKPRCMLRRVSTLGGLGPVGGRGAVLKRASLLQVLMEDEAAVEEGGLGGSRAQTFIYPLGPAPLSSIARSFCSFRRSKKAAAKQTIGSSRAVAVTIARSSSPARRREASAGGQAPITAAHAARAGRPPARVPPPHFLRL